MMFKKFEPKEIYIPMANTYKCAVVDVEDYNKVKDYKWSILRQRGVDRYAIRNTRSINNKKTTVRMHRQILDVNNTKVQVDHINGDGLDNHRSNLRLCNNAENNRNKPPKRKYKGISFVEKNKSNPYVARIKVNYKSIHLGVYKTPELAALAYNKAAIKYHGKFAYLNKVEV